MRGSEIELDNDPYIHMPAEKTKEKSEKDVYLPAYLIKYLRSNSYFNSLSPEDKIFPHTAKTLSLQIKARCLAA